jgi:hypothetical protein
MAAVRWEYKVVTRAEQLNELGLLGWELVSVTCHEGQERYYLKRPLPSLRDQITLDQRKRALEEKGDGEG